VYLESLLTLGTPQSSGENFGCTWKHLGALGTSLGALARTLGAPATSLGAPPITVEQSQNNNIFFGNAAGEPGNHRYYLSFNKFNTHLFSFCCHLCIYIATHLHTMDWDWLQAVLQSNARWVWNWQSSELRDTLQALIEQVSRCTWWRQWSIFPDTPGDSDQLNIEMHSEIVIECISRYTWRPLSYELACHNRACLDMHLEVVI